MRWIGHVAALGLALCGVARAAPTAPAPGAGGAPDRGGIPGRGAPPGATPGAGGAPGAGGSLPLSGGGRPTLLIADGARLDSVDPDSGKVLGSLTPITVQGFTWTRFLRRGRFLLADGQSAWLTTPVRHSVRGLVVIDQTGRVRWTDTHVETMNRTTHAVFLDDEGNVAYDSIDGPTLVLRDGKHVEIGGMPAGPLLHGRLDMLPVRSLGAGGIDHWLTVVPGGAVYSDGKLPADMARRLPVRLTTDDDRWLALVRFIDPAPEDEMYQVEAQTIARLPVPAACRDTLQWAWPTMSATHWMLGCEPRPDEEGRTTRPGTTYVVDVARRSVRRLRPPATDMSDLPREFRRPDDVEATVLPDGTILASVWNHCSTNVVLSKPGGGWKSAGVQPPFGPQFAPEMVCGRLTLQPTLLPANMGCSDGGGVRKGPEAYVRRPDGSWRELPYKVAAPRAVACSPDGEVAASVADGALTTARLDRPERKSVRAGLSKDAPIAWLP